MQNPCLSCVLQSKSSFLVKLEPNNCNILSFIRKAFQILQLSKSIKLVFEYYQRSKNWWLSPNLERAVKKVFLVETIY